MNVWINLPFSASFIVTPVPLEIWSIAVSSHLALVCGILKKEIYQCYPGVFWTS